MISKNSAFIARLASLWLIILVVFMNTAHAQDERDVELGRLFRRNMIAKSTYYHSITKKKLVALVRNRILKLRSEVKNKFVIDYLSKYQNGDINSITVDTTIDQDPDSDYRFDKGAWLRGTLDQFTYIDHYRLVSFSDYSNANNYYILEKYEGPMVYCLYLFSTGANHVLLDTIYLGKFGGILKHTLFQGMNVVQSIQPTHGTGYYHEREKYISINSNKFFVNLEFKRIELSSSLDDPQGTCILRDVESINTGGMVADKIEIHERALRLTSARTNQMFIDAMDQVRKYNWVLKKDNLPMKEDQIVWDVYTSYSWNEEMFCYTPSSDLNPKN
jgi:hypothetical protein